jgi:hypothetical protein
MRHQRLHRVAVHRDQLAQEADRQHLLAVRFLLHDDLGEDLVGDVLAGLGVEDLKIDPLARHPRQVVERDVARRLSVVEPPVGVLLDDDGIGRC